MIVRDFSRRLGVIIALITLASALPLLTSSSAYAAQITSRSLTLVAGSGGNGGSMPGGVVNHLFTFTVPTTTSGVGSIQLLYCTTAAGTCTMPTGLVTTAATLGSNTGSVSGLSLVNTTNGAPYLTRTAANPSGGATTIQLNGVTNPSTTNQTFFVRVSTYTSTNATGTPIDTGTVAASTATQIVLTGTMPESLIFCAGQTVAANCSSTGTGAISFTNLFSPTATTTATSQMAASTNAASGYVITVNGSTLTSGSNTIAAMGTAGTSTTGTAQFGMNLMANTAAASAEFPGSSAGITAASNGTNLRGQALAGYNAANTFKFTSGDSIANSGYTTIGATDSQIYTASYIVNVPGSQPAGTYTTNLTYICTPTF